MARLAPFAEQADMPGGYVNARHDFAPQRLFGLQATQTKLQFIEFH